jgi:hypothetical protein
VIVAVLPLTANAVTDPEAGILLSILRGNPTVTLSPFCGTVPLQEVHEAEALDKSGVVEDATAQLNALAWLAARNAATNRRSVFILPWNYV